MEKHIFKSVQRSRLIYTTIIITRWPLGNVVDDFFIAGKNETYNSKQNKRILSCQHTRATQGIYPERIFKGGEKTTPKLANLSPILVYFSVIPFSPVTNIVLFLTSPGSTLFFIVHSFHSPPVKRLASVPDWLCGQGVCVFPLLFTRSGLLFPLCSHPPTYLYFNNTRARTHMYLFFIIVVVIIQHNKHYGKYFRNGKIKINYKFKIIKNI